MAYELIWPGVLDKTGNIIVFIRYILSLLSISLITLYTINYIKTKQHSLKSILSIILFLSTLIISSIYLENKYIYKLYIEEVEDFKVCVEECVDIYLNEKEQDILLEDINSYRFIPDELSIIDEEVFGFKKIIINDTNIFYKFVEGSDMYDEFYLIGLKHNNINYINSNKESSNLTSIFDEYIELLN